MPKGITPTLIILIAASPLWGCGEKRPDSASAAEDFGAASLATSFEPGGDDPLRDLLAKHKHCSLEDGGLRVNYVGYERGSERVVVHTALPERGDVLTLCYDVRFPEEFDFAKGGKLHGLGPDRPVTGGAPMTPDSWSARVMFTAGGGVATYLYHQDKGERYGILHKTKQFGFTPDTWYAVTLQIGLNTPGKSDGYARLYVDGVLLVEDESVPFRGEGGAASEISTLLFNTFHGGQAPSWAPRSFNGDFATEHAHFDNFAVHASAVVRAAPLTAAP